MKLIKKYQEPTKGIDTGELEEYYPIWLDGITVKPSGNRSTTRDDWSWANWRELQNEREQKAAESVRRGIDKNGTPIAAGIYGLAAAPFAIEGLGSSAVGNGIRTGLQAMNTLYSPSTWLNPVTGAKLLSPTVGTIADAGIQGAFAYEGLNGLWNQGREGTLLSDPASTFMHGLEVLPLVGLGSKAIGMGVDAWNRSGMKALWDISRSDVPVNVQSSVAPRIVEYVPKTEPKARLNLLERRPSKLTEAERFGLPKVDRNNLSVNLLLALEDLAQYRRSGQHRQVFRVTPDWEDFGWNLSSNNPTFMQLFARDGETMSGSWAKVGLKTPTGLGVVGWHPERNMAIYTSRSFPKVEGLKYLPGKANMMLDGDNGHKIILTSPRVDILDFMTDLKNSSDLKDLALYASLNDLLLNTIGKDVMKDFWINARKALRPGTYMSGDNGNLPLGSDLINAFKKRRLHKASIYETPLMQKSISRSGLSPDSYSSIIRLGNRDGSLRWGEGFGTWNNSAVENKYIYEAYLQLMKGEITPDKYADIFNSWTKKIGGRPVEWITKNGKMYPVHPHPYIFAKKKGGKFII